MMKEFAMVEPTAPADVAQQCVEMEIDKSELTATVTWNGIEDDEWGTDKNGERIDPVDGCKYVIKWYEGGLEVGSDDVKWDACHKKDRVKYTIERLLAGVEYTYQITAVNGNAENNTSETPVGGAFDTIEPTVPADIDGDSLDVELDMAKLTVTVTWNGIEDDEWGTDKNGEPINPVDGCKYVISWYEGGLEVGSDDVEWDACHKTDHVAYTIERLLANVEYKYQVVAVNGNAENNTSETPVGGAFRTPKVKTEDL